MQHNQPRAPFLLCRWWLFLRVAALAVLVLGSATGCRTSAGYVIADPKPGAERLRAGGSIQAETDDLIQPLIREKLVAGMVIGAVTPDGQTRVICYGTTGRPGDTNPPTGDSLFQVGSVSKIFVAALLEKLVQEGRLHYSDRVRDILPSGTPVTSEVGEVTLYDLITHTSGLSREPITPAQLGCFFKYIATGGNLYSYLTKPYVYDYLSHAHPHRSEPRKVNYSNVGIGVLATLIEAKTGHPVTELIESEICRPLHMNDSVFTLKPGQAERLAPGHVGSQACWKPAGAILPPWDMGEIMRPVGGMYSSVDDLLIFAKANLGMLHHPLEPVFSATHAPREKTPEQGIALGWLVQSFHDKPLTFKVGMVSGYCAYIGLEPESRVAVVVLSSRFDWDERVGQNLLLRLSEAWREKKQPKGVVAEYVGRP